MRTGRNGTTREAIQITTRPDGVTEPDGFLHLAEAYLVGRDLERAADAPRRALLEAGR